jgi:hypothetical protein
MNYTQVELTHKDETEIWWIPVPEGKAKVGETITRSITNTIGIHSQEWTVSQVCLTLREEDIPTDARKASGFRREAHTIAFMSI